MSTVTNVDAVAGPAIASQIAVEDGASDVGHENSVASGWLWRR